MSSTTLSTNSLFSLLNDHKIASTNAIAHIILKTIQVNGLASGKLHDTKETNPNTSANNKAAQMNIITNAAKKLAMYISGLIIAFNLHHVIIRTSDASAI